MSQSKLGSLIETCTNTALGFIVALISQIVLFPMFGVFVPMTTNLALTFWFTLISIIRGYLIRRFFNKHLYKFASKF